MTAELAAGLLLVLLPVAYNVLFTLLAKNFDYPDILRKPTAEVLARFAAGGSVLLLTWWAFAMSAVLLAPAAVLLSSTLKGATPAVLSLATSIGVTAAIVQFLGLIRWPFAVPYLARTMNDATTSIATKESVEVTFQTLNRYLGVAVGEHLGYLFTGAWTALVGVAILQSEVLHSAFGVIGLVLAPFFFVGAAEFVGAHEEEGWDAAGKLVPIAYVGWSLWLAGMGIALIV